MTQDFSQSGANPHLPGNDPDGSKRVIAAWALGAAFLGLGLALVIGLAARAGGSAHGPAELQQVACPSVGPSGQSLSGKDVCYENNGITYSGGAALFGPFRLIPAGTKPLRRNQEPSNRVVTKSNDPGVAEGTSLLIRPPSGYARVQLQIELWDGEVVRVLQTWKSGATTVNVASGQIFSWQLPFDIYLSDPSAMIQVTSTTVDGHYAILTQPTRGPAPNVGSIKVAMDNWIFELSSPTTAQDVLTAIAISIASGK